MVSSAPPTSTALVGGAALAADQLQLVRLVGQLGAGLVLGDDPAGEPLALLDDRDHALLDRVRGRRG